MLHIGAIICCLALAVPALAQEVPAPLKSGPGADIVAATCGACHTPNYIRMNAPFLTRDGWTAEVTKMRQAFGAPMDDTVATQIVDYLSANYGVPSK